MSNTMKEQAGNPSSPLNSPLKTVKNTRPTFGSKKGKKRGKTKGGSAHTRGTRTPQLEYVSACCSLPARKPACGRKEFQADPESKKPKEVTKGLGHWRCSGCGKSCKVTPRKTKMPDLTQPQVDLRPEVAPAFEQSVEKNQALLQNLAGEGGAEVAQ